MKRLGLGVPALIGVNICKTGHRCQRGGVLGTETSPLPFYDFLQSRFGLFKLALAAVELAQKVQNSERRRMVWPEFTPGEIGERRQGCFGFSLLAL